MMYKGTKLWSDIPIELFDGYTYAWYNFITNIVTNAENRISKVEDLSGNFRHLLQAIINSQPLWSIDGATFDGVDDYLQSTGWNLPKPTTVYVVVQRPYAESSFYFDGTVNSQLRFSSYAPYRPSIRSSTSSIVWGLTSVEIGIKVFALKYDGANSFIRIGAEKQTGTTSAAIITTGLTVGATPDFAIFSRMIFKEIIIRNVSDNINTENNIYNYLKNKYGTPT